MKGKTETRRKQPLEPPGGRNISRKFTLIIVFCIVAVNILIGLMVKHTSLFKCPMRKYKAEREAQISHKATPPGSVSETSQKPNRQPQP